MKLSELYATSVKEAFWKALEEGLEINEQDSGLTNLLSQANEIVFKKFGIQPKERKYFIAGSARLYLYPQLRDAFNLTGTIGDLDIVIPHQEDWVKAGLEKEWNEGGIYRPTNDGSIEAFNVWDPARAGGDYASVQVRPSEQILREATNIGGYFFMPLIDVIDYKTSMNRKKEQDVVSLINAYQKSGEDDRRGFLIRMIRLIGLDKTKEFLGKVAN